MPEYESMIVKLQATEPNTEVLKAIRRGEIVTVILHHTGYQDGTEAVLKVIRA